MQKLIIPFLSIILFLFYNTELSSQQYSHMFSKIANVNNGGIAFDIAEAPDGTILLANGEGGLVAYEYSPIQTQDFWEKTAGNIENVEFLTSNENGDLIASTDTSLFISYDNADSWIEINQGLPDNYFVLAVSCGLENQIYTSIRWAEDFKDVRGVFSWRPHSNGWLNITNNLALDKNNLPGVTAIGINNLGEIYLGAQAFQIYKSIDNGNTWFSSDSGYTGMTPSCIKFNDLNHIFLGCYDYSLTRHLLPTSGVFRSINEGNIWSVQNNGFGDVVEVENIEFNKNGDIFVTGNCLGIYRSTDNGDTWVDMNNNLPISNLDLVNNPLGFTLAIDEQDKIYLGIETGVFRSIDDGESWENTSSGLPSVASVNCLVSSPNGFIYAATDSGIYKSTFQNPVNIKDKKIDNGILSEFTLSQNYPNPFNPITRIKYNIPSAVKSETLPTSRHEAKVTLIVYDILGREAATLVNQKQNPGNYEVEFDASNLTSGIYFYRLRAGDLIETKKMILIK